MKQVKGIAFFMLGIIFLLSGYSAIAQENGYRITGNVKSKFPVDYFNVVVLNANDSSFIKGAVFYSNSFEVGNITAKKVIISISSIAFTTKSKTVSNPNGLPVVDLGEVEVSGQTLKEVTVVANRSIVQSIAGGAVLNVANSPLSNSGTVIDVLKKSPGIIVDKDNNVSVFGKGAAKLYLNGREVTNATEVTELSSEHVTKVEIIKNPSSKYDASANAVVNIITKSKFKDGYNAKTSLYTTYGEYLRVKGDLDFSYRKNSYEVYTFLTTNKNKVKYTDEYYRIIGTGSKEVTMDNRLEKVAKNNFPVYFTVGANYRLGIKHLIGASYTGNFADNKSATSNTNNVKSSTGSTFFNTVTNTKSNRSNNQISLKYQYDVDTNKHKVNLVFDYLNYDGTINDIINESVANGKSSSYDKRNKNTSNYEFFSCLADYTRPLGSESILLSAGLKSTFIESRSNNLFEIFNGGWMPQPDKTIRSKYHENSYAAYIMLEGQFEKLQLSTGIRGERSVMDNSIDLSRSYSNLYPSASASYAFTKNAELSLNYSARYRKPTLADLNPTITYIDSLSYYVGNPSLKAEQINSVDLIFSYLKMASVGVSYVHKRNPMILYVESHPELNNSTYVSMRNFDYSDKLAFTLNLPYETKFWTTYNSFGVEYNKVAYSSASSNAIMLNNSKTMYYAYLYNNFKVAKGVGLYLTYQYNSSGLNGIFEFEQRHILTAGVTAQLSKGLKMHLMYNDILSTDYQKTKAALPTLNLKYNSYYDASYVRLVLTYNFGKDFKVQAIKSGLKDEISRIKEN